MRNGCENLNSRLTKIELLKCLLGAHTFKMIYPGVSRSPLKCATCGYKKYSCDFNESRYEYFRFIATLADGMKESKAHERKHESHHHRNRKQVSLKRAVL